MHETLVRSQSQTHSTTRRQSRRVTASHCQSSHYVRRLSHGNNQSTDRLATTTIPGVTVNTCNSKYVSDAITFSISFVYWSLAPATAARLLASAVAYTTRITAVQNGGRHGTRIGSGPSPIQHAAQPYKMEANRAHV